MTVRLVTFDILHTLITPRMPIHVQYAMAFKPYLGDVDPNSIKGSFKIGDLMHDRHRLIVPYNAMYSIEDSTNRGACI